jgi:hypothetical protein
MITIVRAVQTSIACPAQWDMWDDQGQYYYCRFRHGYGSVTRYETENWVEAGYTEDPDPGKPGSAYRCNAEFIGHVSHFELDSDEDRGWIDLAEFCDRAGLTLAQGAERAGYGDYVMGRLVSDGVLTSEEAQEGEMGRMRQKWNDAGRT